MVLVISKLRHTAVDKTGLVFRVPEKQLLSNSDNNLFKTNVMKYITLLLKHVNVLLFSLDSFPVFVPCYSSQLCVNP